jgi:hypothetical protein
MALSERAQKAQVLTRELQAFGATVTNVLPLEEGKNLRFWISDYKKNELLQQLKDADYEVVFLGMSPQVDVKTYSMGLVNNFEVMLPADRQPVADNRHGGEFAKREPLSAEERGMRKALGLDR